MARGAGEARRRHGARGLPVSTVKKRERRETADGDHCQDFDLFIFPRFRIINSRFWLFKRVTEAFSEFKGKSYGPPKSWVSSTKFVVPK